MAVFTAISTNMIINFYMGGIFLMFGGIILYRVHRRRGMVSTDFGKKNDGLSLSEAAAQAEEDVEAASLLSTESLTYKGGIGCEVLHLPLRYKDSYLLPASFNPIINEYIR